MRVFLTYVLKFIQKQNRPELQSLTRKLVATLQLIHKKHNIPGESILQTHSAYAIMPVGKRTTASIDAQKDEPPEALRVLPGVLLLLGRSQPFGPGYRLFIFVQPLAQVVGNYAGQYGDEEGQQHFHRLHPLSVPV